MNDLITGKMLRDAIISASNNVSAHRREIDALNVFPVPDGDTGTNMSMTLGAAAREASVLPDDVNVADASERIASALLRGARGNSGVILSLIFRGISKAIKGVGAAGAKDISRALASGKDSAYKAVMKPTEGTILTVVRVASEEAEKVSSDGGDVRATCAAAFNGAKRALAQTPDILPVLKSAGVVDAGGQGLVYVFEGMRSVFFHNTIIGAPDGAAEAAGHEAAAFGSVRIAAEEIRFTYCTEFIINRDRSSAESPIKLRAYLESVGDSAVVVDDDSIIKVHVHSNEPGNIIQKALLYGDLVSIKIENMKEQHENAMWDAVSEQSEDGDLPAAEALAEPLGEKKRYGMVAVASGEGFEEMFREIGVDKVVSGGQTMNPSTEDILRAVQMIPADHIFILPNNKNIIMAAEQVAPLTEKGISVLHTKSLPQGITAALNFDETAEPGENHLAMMKAAEKVGTGLVTFAARDSVVNGQKVKKGEMLGMENGKITVTGADMVNTAFKVARHLCKKDSAASLVTIFYGGGADEKSADEVAAMLRAKHGSDLDISVVDGGQPVYFFVISVE